MRIAEAVRTGTSEIMHHKMRSFLSFFAISIGVVSILYCLLSMYSMRYRMNAALQIAGPGRLTVGIEGSNWNKSSGKEGMDILTLDDALAIRRQMPELFMVSPIQRKWRIYFGHKDFKDERQRVTAVTPEWRKRDWNYVSLKGRFIDQKDIDNYNRVCVLIQDGGWVKKPAYYKLYQWHFQAPFKSYVLHNNLLGEQVRLGNHLYRVIGILKQPPNDRDPGWIGVDTWNSAEILVPLTTAQRLMADRWDNQDNIGMVDQIDIDTGDEKTIPSYKRKIEQLIASRHPGKSIFEVKDYRDSIKKVVADKKRDMYTVFIIGIIAILAGGIGITNVTLATIFSRIREIGIRRALGATKGDIMGQFIIEAMLLGFLGGIAGMVLGMAGIQYLTSQSNDYLIMRWWMPVIAVLAAVLTGFVAAIYPAYQASKLDPVEALRYE